MGECVIEQTFEDFLGGIPKITSGKKPVALVQSFQPLLRFISSVADAKADFVAEKHKPIARIVADIAAAPAKLPVSKLRSHLRTFLPLYSIDAPDAVFNVDDRENALVRLMGHSCGRLIVEQAREVCNGRADEEGFSNDCENAIETMDKLMPKLTTATPSD